MKTGTIIEQDVFDLIKTSDLGLFVKGKVYKEGMRPIKSTKEDIVISFLSGLDGQFQYGTVNVNVFIPDVNIEGYPVPDSYRIKDAEKKALSSVNGLESTDYHFFLNDIIKTFKAENEQHFINVKLKFKRLN